MNTKITGIKCQYCNDEEEHKEHHLCYNALNASDGGFEIIGDTCKKTCKIDIKYLFYDIHTYKIDENRIVEDVNKYILDKIENCEIQDLHDIRNDIIQLNKKKYEGKHLIEILDEKVKVFHKEFGDFDIKLLGGYTSDEIKAIIAVDDYVDLEERLFIYLSSK